MLMLTGECSNKECPFLHIDPESKIKDCPWYDRGFCKHGRSHDPLPIRPAAFDVVINSNMLPLFIFLSMFTFNDMFSLPLISGPDCRHRHTRRVICVNYLVGFCPEGKSCKFMQYVIVFI